VVVSFLLVAVCIEFCNSVKVISKKLILTLCSSNDVNFIFGDRILNSDKMSTFVAFPL